MRPPSYSSSMISPQAGFCRVAVIASAGMVRTISVMPSGSVPCCALEMSSKRYPVTETPPRADNRTLLSRDLGALGAGRARTQQGCSTARDKYGARRKPVGPRVEPRRAKRGGGVRETPRVPPTRGETRACVTPVPRQDQARSWLERGTRFSAIWNFSKLTSMPRRWLRLPMQSV